MTRQSRNSAETASHPFRSMFELMLALVFMLLAFIGMRAPKRPGPSSSQPAVVDSATNTQFSLDELLLLHNIQRRLDNESASLLTDLKELSPDDACTKIAARNEGILSDGDRQELEQHRTALWNKPGVKEAIKRRLLNKPITWIVPENGEGSINFPTAQDHPANLNDANPTIDWILKQLKIANDAKFPITRIRIEGHTDNVTISNPFPDNWALSKARAVWLARKVKEALAKTQFHDVLIVPIGYADRIPADWKGRKGDPEQYPSPADTETIKQYNKTDGDKLHNRRIRIVLEQN